MRKELLDLIEKYKEEIVESDTWKTVCKNHKVEPEVIFTIPTCFTKLDVSARTENGIVYLNFRLLKTPKDIKHYMNHEYTHHLQQCFGDGPTEGSNDANYLDNPAEQESFKNQTAYIEETEGDREAEQYINKVLDHHNISPEEKPERKKELLAITNDIKLNKKAALFSFPQGPIDEITKNVLDLFAAQVWERIEYYTDPFEKDKVILKNNEEIINECKKFTNAPAAKLVGKGSFSINFSKLISDIRGWSYLKGVELSADKIVAKLKSKDTRPWPEEIKIYMYFTEKSAKLLGTDNSKPNIGFFNPPDKSLHISAGTDKITDLKEFFKTKDEIIGTIRHEILHLAQVLLYDIKALKAGAGLPRRKRYEKREDVYGRPGLPVKKKKTFNEIYEQIYAPIAEEFANSVKRFLRVIKRDVITKEERPDLKEDLQLEDLIRERAKAWVGFPNSFEEITEKYGRHEREFTSPLFLRLEKENISKWKMIANSFLMAVTRITGKSLQAEHPLRDIEFYTDLQDAVREFNLAAENLPKDDIGLRREFAGFFLREPNNFIELYLKYFPADDEEDKAARQKLYKMKDEGPYNAYSFFSWLKEKDHAKWKKAIKEFMKAIGL